MHFFKEVAPSWHHSTKLQILENSEEALFTHFITFAAEPKKGYEQYYSRSQTHKKARGLIILELTSFFYNLLQLIITLNIHSHRRNISEIMINSCV
jgi:hypothetical protein